MKKILPAILLILAGLFLGGCNLLYDTTEEGAMLYDQHGNQMHLTTEQLQSLGSAENIEEYFERAFPQSYSQPNAAPAEIVSQATEANVQTRAEVESGIGLVKSLPIPGADVLGWILGGVTGIGAIWQRRRLKTSEKVSQSLVQGIDTFRDVLDQTKGGEALDEWLKTSLKTQKDKLQVATEIADLMSRYTTPTKPQGGVRGEFYQTPIKQG